MTDEQQELLQKAQKSLAAAKLLLANGYPEYAISRAYYTIFDISEIHIPSPTPE